jgi:hypothetical protein
MALLLVLAVLAVDAVMRRALRIRTTPPTWSEAPGTPLSAL